MECGGSTLIMWFSPARKNAAAQVEIGLARPPVREAADHHRGDGPEEVRPYGHPWEPKVGGEEHACGGVEDGCDDVGQHLIQVHPP